MPARAAVQGYQQEKQNHEDFLRGYSPRLSDSIRSSVSGYFFFVVFLAFFAGAFFFAGMICSPPFTILTFRR
jgi:hypothetical protein